MSSILDPMALLLGDPGGKKKKECSQRGLEVELGSRCFKFFFFLCSEFYVPPQSHPNVLNEFNLFNFFYLRFIQFILLIIYSITSLVKKKKILGAKKNCKFSAA